MIIMKILIKMLIIIENNYNKDIKDVNKNRK